MSIVGIERVNRVEDKNEIRDAVFKLLSQMNGNCRWNLTSGTSIMIKVNLCLIRGYETGTTVDPFVAKCLCEWLNHEFHPKIIYIGEADATELNADIAFKALGWEAEFDGMDNVKLINLSKDDLITAKLENGLFFKELEMSRKYMEASFLISLAKLKTNDMTGITCILKNQFGITPVKYKAQYHSHLNECIFDLNLLRRPDLCIVDGIIAMEGAGPVDGIPKPVGLLIAANDPVAADHACAKIMMIPITAIPSLRLAIKRKLGSTNYRVIGKQVNEVKTRFIRPTKPQTMITNTYVFLRKHIRSVKPSSQVRNAGDKKVKVGVIGLGAVSEILHLPVLSAISNCEIVAASEKDPLRQHRRKLEWKIPHIYEDYEVMFNETDLDAVFVCLPTYFHYDAVKCALEHNVHVFCEKPLGLSSEKAHELVELARKLDLNLTVGYSRMLYEGYQKARDLIKGQRLGKVLQVRGALSNKGPYAGWTPRSDWFFDAKGGGVLFDSGSHLFSILMHILDDRINEVSCLSATTYAISNIRDQISGCFKTESGILGTFNIGWKSANESNMIEVIGTGGSLVIDSNGVEMKLGSFKSLDRISNRLNAFWQSVNQQFRGLYSSLSNPILTEDNAFIEAVAAKGRPLVKGEDAVHILAVLEAISRSLETGTKTQVIRY